MPLNIQELVTTHRNERLGRFFGEEVQFLTGVHTPRKYQEEIMYKTQRDISQGIHTGRWDIALGGGKTYMALSLMKHVTERGGKVLYLAPGNTEMDNVMHSHIDKYQLGNTNLLQFTQESDILDISNSRKRSFYDTVPYHYSTGGMLLYNERYKNISPDYYDCIVIDESQGFLGEQISDICKYFYGAQVHMSATPYNNQKHLGNSVPHVYGEISSEYLIENYDYPKWMISNYHINEDREEGNIPLGDELNFENKQYHDLLNMSERFRILETIFEDIIISGDKKGLAFMPSVKDAEFFVKHIVPTNDILAGRVDFVAGVRGRKENKDIEKKLRAGVLQIVLCKDLWNQSLDIPEITDIILNDPTRSLQRLLQRIGRGVRPSKGKDSLRIHDLLSSFFHSQQVGIPAITADSLLSSDKKSTGNRDTSLATLQSSEDISPEFIVALNKRRSEKIIGLTSCELELRQEMQESYFLADSNFSIEVFINFAINIFHIHPQQLLLNTKYYKKNTTKSNIKFQSKQVSLSFENFLEIIEFYGTLDNVETYDYIKHISSDIQKKELSGIDEKIVQLRQKSVKNIEDILMMSNIQNGETPVYEGKFDPKYSMDLMEYIQKNKKSIEWEEKYIRSDMGVIRYFSYHVYIKSREGTHVYKGEKWSDSKKKAKHYISQEILKKIKAGQKIGKKTKQSGETITDIVTNEEAFKDVGTSKNIPMFEGEPYFKSSVYLENFINFNEGKKEWKEKTIISEDDNQPYFSYEVIIELEGKSYVFDNCKWTTSRKKAKHYISREINEFFQGIGLMDNGDELILKTEKKYIDINLVISHTKLIDAEAILNVLKAKSKVSKIVYREEKEEAQTVEETEKEEGGSLIGSIIVLNNQQKFISASYSFDTKEERKLVKKKIRKDILSQIMELKIIQDFWRKKLKLQS